MLRLTEKNDKQYVKLQLRIPGTQVAFLMKLPLILMVLLMNQLIDAMRSSCMKYFYA